MAIENTVVARIFKFHRISESQWRHRRFPEFVKQAHADEAAAILIMPAGRR
jgi:hypothetical protein